MNELVDSLIYQPDHSQKEFIPQSLLKSEPLASIINPGNFSDSGKVFTIDKERTVNIFAVGEINNSLITGNHVKYIPFDRAELYFDLKNDKSREFRSGDDDRQFVLSYGLPNIEGLNFVSDDVKVEMNEPTPKQYVFEMRLSWKSLGFVKPVVGRKIGFNSRIIDNDYPDERSDIKFINRPKLINLFGTEANLFNPSLYGTLLLDGDVKSAVDKHVIASQKLEINKPKIDGKKDMLWEQVMPVNINTVIKGKIEGQQDLNATIRSCWDSNYLYFLIEVTDDRKVFFNGLMDYGWIEDMKGNIKWLMSTVTAGYAGGAAKNQIIVSKLSLPPGKYKLRYITDESHAFGNWNAPPPITPFYGIAVYK
ncbi:sugar-binding protein [Mucilaginibacter rivuli]|uniref:sugar-binding protein n=1 Tax=Mucilaginibacter rivuli TaxID=2857527 RepID=UPI002105C0DA|nr:sugar-binding protein [Mucilaginibacter rivuli]